MTRRVPLPLTIDEIVSKPPLLVTEREEDFRELQRALVQELKPRGAVEEIYVADLAICVWEILQLRRAKAALINLEFKRAVFDVLHRLSGMPSHTSPKFELAASLSESWSCNPDSRKQVLSTLKQHSLDETAIEAEAIRRNASDLEMLDRMLTVQEARRDKVLRAMAHYRESFANQARAASNQIIEVAPVIQLENRSAPTKK